MINAPFSTSTRTGYQASAMPADTGAHAIAHDMPTPDIRLVDRPMTEADIPAVLAMEQAACLLPAHAWSEENYRSSMRAGYWVRVRCEAVSGRIVAVCVAMDGVDEVHLLNIAVAQPFHGRGVARSVLGVLYARCRQQRAPTLWLEVRPSNTAARGLYLSEGFAEVGVRKNYYPAVGGREDALVMKLDIDLYNGATHALD
jgi:[ribosomal protein S18]-alanine N-acetyltransferase